ncbi:MAG: ABC transporter permease [Alphaproteobacteria bacterium]|nr:ABC transporter permease [Alphaproteobacteria bacterium]
MTLPLELSIALSHLLHRRRQTLISVLGVAMGVGFFIGISSLMQGFQHYFVEKVIDVQPHILMKDEFRVPEAQPVEREFSSAAIELGGVKPRDEVRGIRGARRILAEIRQMPGVHVAPTMAGQVLLRYGAKSVSVSISGIEPALDRRVTNLERDLTEGALDNLYTAGNGIILGVGVANKAGVGMGDTLSVISPQGVVLKMKVVGIFSSGITTMDNYDTYILLKKAQILHNRPNVINRLRIRLDDVEQAESLARKLEDRYGYRAESWKEASKNVLGIFVIQNGIMYSTVSAILIVACFGIFNVISTVVFEKTRDIAILKSMGFSEGDIRRIFLIEGLLAGLVGSVLGWLLGWGIVELLASIRFQMEGFVRTEGFVLYRTPIQYALGALVASASAILASWLPARRAARLNPVDIVRGL